MNPKTKTKKTEGVDIMLSIKAEISEKFAKNPDAILKNLLAIRKKYNLHGDNKKKLPIG